MVHGKMQRDVTGNGEMGHSVLDTVASDGNPPETLGRALACL